MEYWYCVAGELVVCANERANVVRRPKGKIDEHLLQVQGDESGDLEVGEDGDGCGAEQDELDADQHGESWSDIAGKVDELHTRMAEHFEDQHDNETKGPPITKAPIQPTREQWERHQITHTPYELWCVHCGAARAVRRNHPKKRTKAHIVPDTDTSEEGPVTISMDHMYLHDRIGKYKDETWNPTCLVVIEHRYGRCWAYRVPNKGQMEGAYWPPKRLLQDCDNCVPKGTRTILKTNQEPDVTSVQSAVQELRPKGAVPVNSPVGESGCNGRTENAIRRFQEKARALRHGLEKGIGEKLSGNSRIMAWFVRFKRGSSHEGSTMRSGTRKIWRSCTSGGAGQWGCGNRRRRGPRS